MQIRVDSALAFLAPSLHTDACDITVDIFSGRFHVLIALMDRGPTGGRNPSTFSVSAGEMHLCRCSASRPWQIEHILNGVQGESLNQDGEFTFSFLFALFPSKETF